MGAVVHVSALSHAPHITAFPDRAPVGAKERIYAAMAALGSELRDARPDVIVVVSSDHFHNLFTDRMPAFCVGLAATYRGPAEGWIRLDPFQVPGSADFGRAIVEQAFADGIDPAFAHAMVMEHGMAVPLSFLTPRFDIPIVPVVQNCIVPPLPPLARCVALGRSIRRAADASALRVAVVGTGGLSHAPGAPDAGAIDTVFDRAFLAMLATRPLDCLDIADERLDRAGFGSWEIRQWMTALGAAGGGRADVLAYEPIPEWETGCAVARFNCSDAAPTDGERQ